MRLLRWNGDSTPKWRLPWCNASSYLLNTLIKHNTYDTAIMNMIITNIHLFIYWSLLLHLDSSYSSVSNKSRCLINIITSIIFDTRFEIKVIVELRTGSIYWHKVKLQSDMNCKKNVQLWPTSSTSFSSITIFFTQLNCRI